MTRPILTALGIGLLAGIGWLYEAQLGDGMPSYLAAWLFWMAVPMGALPLVMALEALGHSGWAILPTLRRCALLLPVGGLFCIPVLTHAAPLFNRVGLANALPAAWMAPGFFVARSVVVLVVLSLLALVFGRPVKRQPRRGLAVLGLILHVGLVSVMAVDWVMSLQPGLGSDGFGLLLIASQAGIAASLAVFVVAVGTPGRLPAGLGLLLATLLAGWGFLHFIQFLVVWSANLPAEVTWYLDRQAGWGTPMVWSAVAIVLAALVLLPTRLAGIPAVAATLAGAVLAMHLGEVLWLVTPAFRGRFDVTAADSLAVLGIGGLLVTLLLATLAFDRSGGRHAAP